MDASRRSPERSLLIVAPFRGDAAVLQRVAGTLYRVQACADLDSLSRKIGDETGIILITEEALTGDTQGLGTALADQASWSDIPILLLTSSRNSAGKDIDVVRRRLPASASNVVVLERPMGSSALMSAIAAAWQSRARQFDMRDRVSELALERERLRILLENVPVGISFVDINGQSLISNPLYNRYVPDRVIPSKGGSGQEHWVSVDSHGQRVKPDMFPGARALRGEAVDGVVFCHKPVGHDASWIRMSAVPLWGTQGAIIGAALVIVNITDQKQAELTLREFNESLEAQVASRTQALALAVEQLHRESRERERAEDQLRQSLKMEAVGQLTGGIAHDFNNMLTGILSALDLLRLRLKKGSVDALERYIDAAQASATRAASLTERLLAFSRRQSLDARPFSANDLIGGLYDLLKRSATEQIRVLVNLSDQLPWALADTNQLENALLNLVINARDAMPNGGTITVSTHEVLIAGQAPTADELADGRYIRIDVEDTGTGISVELIPKVIEPFFTTKPIGQGTGLGLSMVYGFAKQSRGKMEISSIAGEGTKISLYLPTADNALEPPVDTGHSANHGTGQRILLVEDDESVRMLNREVLCELGYEIFVARDAEEALHVLMTMESVDILVTDVGLPGMNGRQLAEIAQQRYPRLPVLFLTGYAQAAADRESFLGEHMRLLTKPFTLQALAECVSMMLEPNDAQP
ncbi:ATP-binding protein [Pseudomonas alloputida]|uniref:ATP-binding protein n=1 Tax=Pseudomonas TaxID=286 RepID=UPI003EEAA41C